MSYIHNLSKTVYSEPTSKKLRPPLIDYIKYYVDKAKSLPEDELLHGKGWDYASSICGALAWQGAKDVKSDEWISNWINYGKKQQANIYPEDSGWITEKDEPMLWKIFAVTSPLDVDSNNIDKWHELFELVDNL